MNPILFAILFVIFTVAWWKFYKANCWPDEMGAIGRIVLSVIGGGGVAAPVAAILS